MPEARTRTRVQEKRVGQEGGTKEKERVKKKAPRMPPRSSSSFDAPCGISLNLPVEGLQGYLARKKSAPPLGSYSPPPRTLQ